MARRVRCILDLNGYLAPKIFSGISLKEISKLRSAGFNGEEIASYQKRGERLHSKILELNRVSYREGSIAIENELFHLGQTTYGVLKNNLEGEHGELAALLKLDILERFYRGYGDILSRELFNFIQVKGKKDMKKILQQTYIPEQLLLRTMPREEYFAYLLGEKPVIEGKLTLRHSNLELTFEDDQVPSCKDDDDVPF